MGVIRKDMKEKIVISNSKYRRDEQYEQIGILGGNKGGQGKIYKIKDKNTNFVFALKQV